MNSLYPIIRRVRRALLPPDDIAPVVAPVVVEPSPAVPPVEVVVVETSQVVADSQSSSLPGDDQSLLTSAATKGMRGKQAAAKSRVKAADEAHITQP